MPIDHPKPELVRAAAHRRLQAQMRSMDPTVTAAAEMATGREDGRFKDQVEKLLREAQTIFDPTALIAAAEERI
jgi:hypothetical protein